MRYKELLSEVLNLQLENCFFYKNNCCVESLSRNIDNDKEAELKELYKIKNSEWTNKSEIEFNIYELAFKVKTWALGHNYLLHSGPSPMCGFNADVMRRFTDDKWLGFNAETEPEAVFKAGEWILKQLNEGE